MSVKEYIKAIAAFGILVAVFMAGFTISGGFWSSSNAGLQNDLRRSREALDQLHAELDKVKLEYSQYRDSHPSSNTVALKPATQVASTTDEKPVSKADQTQTGQAELSLGAGQSGTAEAGEVIISVIGIALEGDPLRDKVTFRVGGPGAQPTTYEKQDVGAVARWRKFEVRLLSADTFNARFLVTRFGSP